MRTLTSKEYVKIFGSQCPACKSDAIKSEPATNEGDGFWDVHCSCGDCSAIWVDSLQLTHYRDLELDIQGCVQVNDELLICERVGDLEHLIDALKNGSSDLDMDTMPPCDYSVSIGEAKPNDDGLYLIEGIWYEPDMKFNNPELEV